MIGIEDLKSLREAHGAASEISPGEALRAIGNPPAAAIVESALALMARRDRNLRVLALRLLARRHGERAMRGVLAGLDDEKRRVCAVAIQACPNYLGYEAIAARLEAIARDAGRKRKLRRRALSMLAGDEGRLQGDLSQAASAALERLMADDANRFPIVFALARLELAPRVKRLLEVFAKAADRRERDMAARALGGERVIHIGNYEADEARRRWILAHCERAYGRMYYWLPRETLALQGQAST